jgi:deoxyribonuclease-4
MAKSTARRRAAKSSAGDSKDPGPPSPPFGAHLSIAGGHDRAVRAAAALGFAAVQLFTKNSNQWAARPLEPEGIERFRAAVSETGITRLVGHNSYLINLASPDDALRAKSIAAMIDELERAEALGLADLVIHPGAHMGEGEAAGLSRVAESIDAIHGRTKGFSCRIALETTAGQGTCLGHRLEHLGAILAAVRDAGRLSVCVDTCHLFAAGYSFGDEAGYNAMIDELDRAVGLGRVRVWHLNDSQRECGSRVDRHAGIGRGRMGLEPFRRVVNDPRFAAVPMILETPKGTEGSRELDAVNLETLRRLRSGG